MRKIQVAILLFLVVFAGAWLMVGAFLVPSADVQKAEEGERLEHVILPEPEIKGDVSVEEAIFKRRSTRRYKQEPLTLHEVSQILWAAVGKTVDGVTGPTRAYPSAGASHPLEAYLVVGDVEGLASGVYRYNWQDHSLSLVIGEDVRPELTDAALRQTMIRDAPASIVFTAIFTRTTLRYGPRGEVRYVPMDAGAAFQNVHLQAQALGLGTVIIGAFSDEGVKDVLNLENEVPLGIMPVGRI